MRFVPGRSLELGSATSAEIEHLGSVVAGVHARPVHDLATSFAESGTARSYAEDRLQHILHGLPWARDPLPAELRDGVRHAAIVIQDRWDVRRDTESFGTDEALSLLHGDIASGNVLWGPDPVLVDWEYARLGDPSDEIAYLFDQNGLSPPQREAFWRGYGARAGNGASFAHTMERVSWWEPLTLLGSTLWWIERWVRRTEADAEGTNDPAVSKDPGYYFERAASRLDRLEHLTNPA
jgi:Ser/Thr protein kinase RdoA (MazF antagonist)